MVLGKNNSTYFALLHLHDKVTSAIDERKYTAGLFLDFSIKLTIITVFYLVNVSIMGSVDWPLNGSRAIFATGYSMLNSMVFHPLIMKTSVVYLRGQSLVPYSF